MIENNINGWIILDKPYDMTSTRASSLVRRLFGVKKAGHLGTLDPLATGVLPIALGEATKTIPYLQVPIKQYSFQVTWGEQRSTDDTQGEVVSTCEKRPTPQDIQAILPRFIGTIQQQPPLFSALKVKGIRAYDLARREIGENLDKLKEAVKQKTRPVTIHNLVLESIDSAENATFVVTCGPGTYVRSLARDMAEALGTVAYVSRLRRIQDGKFQQKDAISLENLQKLGHKSELHRICLPLGTVLDDIPAVSISVEEAMMINQGQRIPIRINQETKNLVVLKQMQQVIAIAQSIEGYFYPKRVFK